MRVSYSAAVFLAWLCAVAFSADLYATTMLPGAPVAAEHSADDGRADTERSVAVWALAGGGVGMLGGGLLLLFGLLLLSTSFATRPMLLG